MNDDTCKYIANFVPKMGETVTLTINENSHAIVPKCFMLIHRIYTINHNMIIYMDTIYILVLDETC